MSPITHPSLEELSCQTYPAIYGENIAMSLTSYFETTKIFKDLCINVPVGSIYGLIGPSGCGKTTFFRCLLGRFNLESGTLLLFGRRPKETGSNIPGSDVGYMPQDIALDQDLTVQETLYFFARLNGLASSVVGERILEFSEILSIDDIHMSVSNLSTGQQRRLSLACALVHRPRLVLLDEPTVGSDPILVQKIWNYLESFKNQWNSTIILSTHYLEEVRRADYFAFMNEGKILFQDVPRNFMRTWGKISLEEAILAVCTDKSHIKSLSSVKPTEKISYQMENFNEHQNHGSTGFLNTFKLLLWRYQVRWRKNMIYRLIGIALVQTVITALLGLLYGGFPQDLSIGIVKQDQSGSLSQDFVAQLANNTKNWNFPAFSNENDARNQLEHRLIDSYLVIGESFSESIIQRLKYGFSSRLKVNIIKNGQIFLIQDTTNRFIADAIEIAVMRSLSHLIEKLEATTNGSTTAVKGPGSKVIQVHPVFGDLDEGLKHLAPIQSILIKFFFQLTEQCILTITMLWVTREFHEAVIERLTASAIYRFELTCALIFALLITLIPILIISCLILCPIVGWPVDAVSFCGFAALVFPALILTSITRGILLGSVTSSPAYGILMSVSYGFTGIFAASILWPPEAMPYFITPLRLLYSHSQAGVSAVRSMIYGDSLHQVQVYSGLNYVWAHALITSAFILLWTHSTR